MLESRFKLRNLVFYNPSIKENRHWIGKMHFVFRTQSYCRANNHFSKCISKIRLTNTVVQGCFLGNVPIYFRGLILNTYLFACEQSWHWLVRQLAKKRSRRGYIGARFAQIARFWLIGTKKLQGRLPAYISGCKTESGSRKWSRGRESAPEVTAKSHSITLHCRPSNPMFFLFWAARPSPNFRSQKQPNSSNP